MKRLSFVVLCASIAISLPGCKIVKDTPAGKTKVAADASGDDVRTKARIADTFQSKLVPYISKNAVNLPELRHSLANGFKAASAAHGTRGSGAGAAWNFPIKGKGKIIETKLNSRARTLSLDSNNDGVIDVTVQLGPVIRGSSLRDVAPFYNFDDFRDQIEFAKLSRALNDKISKSIKVPEGNLVGQHAEFVGVVSLKSINQAYLVTPITIEVTP